MLTRKQYELLVYIDKHLKQTGFSPSFEEMKDALNLKSKSGIHRLISALEERGYLARRHHRARALDVLRLPDNMQPREMQPQASTGAEAVQASSSPTFSPPSFPPPAFSPNVIRGDFTQRLPGVRTANDAGAIQLPMYGRIAAGLPIEALRDNETQIEVPLSLLGAGEHYGLEVAGDSMIEAGILDGDMVIILKGDTAENGQIVVALVDDTEVTLKRLRRRGNSIALEPCNERHETRIFPADRVKVQGRIVALMRKY
jgi:repressor LexA